MHFRGVLHVRGIHYIQPHLLAASFAITRGLLNTPMAGATSMGSKINIHAHKHVIRKIITVINREALMNIH